MLSILQSQGKTFDRNIAKLLFQKMDKNRDGSISLDEFITAYVDGEIKLKERLNEIIKAIAERKRQIEEFRARLQDAKVNTFCLYLKNYYRKMRN